MKKLIKRELPKEFAPDFESNPNAKTQPTQLRSFQSQPRGGNRAPRKMPSQLSSNRSRVAQVTVEAHKPGIEAS